MLRVIHLGGTFPLNATREDTQALERQELVQMTVIGSQPRIVSGQEAWQEVRNSVYFWVWDRNSQTVSRGSRIANKRFEFRFRP